VLALAGTNDWRLQLNHAIATQRAGDLTQARVEFEGTVALARKTGDDSAAPGTALEYLANFYDDIGDFGQAELTLNKCLSVWQQLLGSNNIALARIVRRMASVYIERGELMRAVKLDLPHWIERVQNEAPQSDDLIGLLNASASLESALHHFAGSVELHRKTLDLIEARGGNDAAEAIELNNFGIVYIREGNFDEAVSVLSRALDLWRDSAQPRDVGTLAMICQNLAEAFTKAGRFSEAEKVLESVRVSALHAYGADTPRMAGFLLVQAELLRAEKHAAEAKKLTRQVKTIMARYAQSDPSRGVVDVSAFVGQ